MTTPMSADRMVSILEAEGVRVVEHRSWRTNNRNHVGEWGPVHGVMIHHTVTSGTESSVELCYNGHSNLPGPLCHGVIAKDGTVHLVGHGRANHAGLGDGDVLAAVREERPLPRDNEADTDGNKHFYGFEAINLGDGEDPWPEEQVEAIVRVSAAICRTHQWGEEGPTSVIGHLEWQPGKIDPRGISMNAIRARVWDRLDRPPNWNPGGEDVPAFLALGMTANTEIHARGVKVSLAWDTEWADEANQHGEGAQVFARAGTQYNGVLTLRLRGLRPGAEVQVWAVDDDRSLLLGEGVGTEGGSFPSIPVCDRAVGDTKLMIAHFNPEGESVVLERAELKAQMWPR